MAVRLRSITSAKRQYKEKLVPIYDSLFKGEDITSTHPNFWGELFLIKPMVMHIQNEILRMNEEQRNVCQQNLASLIQHCIDTLSDEHPFRVVYAFQTLTAIVQSIFKKANQDTYDVNIADFLLTFNLSESRMIIVIQHCNNFIKGNFSDNMKALSLKLLLIIITGMDNIDQNIFLEYIMLNNIFESLTQLLKDTSARNKHGTDVLLLLTILINYRKYESENPYIVKLSILDDELVLNGFGHIISSTLSDFCKQFIQINTEANVSWLSSLTSLVGGMLLGEEETRAHHMRASNNLLLALYEATHLNRNFVMTLAYTQSETTSPYSILGLNIEAIDPNSVDVIAPPFNLLAIFLQYCSIVMQSLRTEAILYNAKLCFLILYCITEDQYANSLMHDPNLAFRIQLHKVRMHHRKLINKPAPVQPLAATLLDLLVEFITSHLMKKFPLELYHQCMDILQRLLCYQKRCRIRLNYQWKELWNALINLLKFLTTHEGYLTKKMNIFPLSIQAVNILNFFITYGDTFLYTPGTYDNLFYELIRMRLIFTNLYAMALRYSNNEVYEYKESATKLTNSLMNIRDIVNHFPQKIAVWLASENVSTPTEEQILRVINQNYDNITLKLQDSLDQYQRYSEAPFYSIFFKEMIFGIVIDTRGSIDISNLDTQAILQQLTSTMQ